MKLIDKDVLLLKIDSKIEVAQKVFNDVPSSVIGGIIEGYTRTKKIINSLEVIDVECGKNKRSPASEIDTDTCWDDGNF